MKILLITYYWEPFNHSGTFRWYHFGQHIDFDVLTSTKPRRAMYDTTIPKLDKRVYRYGLNLRPLLWGLRTNNYLRDFQYDLYVFTAPPYSLVWVAYRLQRRGKKVLVDLRDSIPYPQQKWYERILNPFYKYWLSKIKNITKCYDFIYQKGRTVYNGYKDNI